MKRTKNRPDVRNILRRISSGMAGANEAALLKDLLDAMDDQITALRLQEKQGKTKTARVPGLF